MGGFLISPTEPPLIKALGQTVATPERFGADILWAERSIGGLIGVQRKELSDLLNSVADGRLAKEVQQLRSVKLPILIVEGRPHWTTGGELVHANHRWTRTQHRSLLRSIQLRGIVVEQTESTADTVGLIEDIAKWAAKTDHTTLDTRPKPKPSASSWGQMTDEAWACHMLQSVEGIGPKQAKAIWDHFGGKLPIGITVTDEELAEVPGLGAKKITTLRRAFSG